MNIGTIFAGASGDMWNRGWLDFGGILYDLLCTILYYLTCGITFLIHYISMAFYYLVGDMSKFGDTSSKFTLETLWPTLVQEDGVWRFDGGLLFNGNGEPFIKNGFLNFNNSLVKGTLIILIIGFVILILSLCWGIYKGATDKEGNGHAISKSAVFNSFKALIMVCVAPIFIFITIGMITSTINLVMSSFQGALLGLDPEEEQPLAEIIFRCCFPDYGQKLKDLNWDFWDISEPFKINLPSFESPLSDSGLDAVTSNSILYNIYDMRLTGDSIFNYLIGIVGGICTIVALGLLVIRLAERIIEVISDYFYSIPSIATYPADNGERFKTWLELFSGRLLGFVGSYIGLIIYLFILRLVQPPFSSLIGENANIKNYPAVFGYSIILLIIVIGGAFATVKGGNMVAQLIGVKAGQAEATSMGQSMGLASMSMRAIGGVAKRVGATVVGTAALMKQGASQSKAQLGLNKINSSKHGGGGGGDSGGSGGLGGDGGSSPLSTNSLLQPASSAFSGFKDRVSALKRSNVESVARGGKSLGIRGYAGAVLAGTGSLLTHGAITGAKKMGGGLFHLAQHGARKLSNSKAGQGLRNFYKNNIRNTKFGSNTAKAIKGVKKGFANFGNKMVNAGHKVRFKANSFVHGRELATRLENAHSIMKSHNISKVNQHQKINSMVKNYYKKSK